MSGQPKRFCAKCQKREIPTVGVKTGKASPAAGRFKKGQYAGRWLCWTCALVEKPKGQLVETLYVADPKGQELEPAPEQGATDPAAGAEQPLPQAEAQQ